MNNLNVAGRIAEDYRKSYSCVNISELSHDVFDEMLATCDKMKHMEERTEWYDDLHDPNLNTWTDVEGEGYGWIWVKQSENKWHELLRNSLISYIKHKKEELHKVNGIVMKASDKDTTIYHIVDREHSNQDAIYTFSNNEIYY